MAEKDVAFNNNVNEDRPQRRGNKSLKRCT